MKVAILRLRSSVAGLSPEAVSLIFAAGVVFGVFPVIGCPTLLCFVAALVFRLNLPAIQLVNQLCSPLQWALLIPFARLGARLAASHAAWSMAGAARDAVAGWLCLSIPLGLILYFVLLFTLRRCRRQCFQ